VKQKVVLQNWNQGLWTDGPACKAGPFQMTYCVNVTATETGSLRTRPGCGRFLPLANTIDGTYVGDAHFFKTSDNKIYRNTTSLDFYQYGSLLRVADCSTLGVDGDILFFPYAMKKYRTGVDKWGIQEVPEAPSASVGGSGNLSGTYSYRVTYYNSSTRTESPPSGASNTVTVTSQKANLTLPTVCTDPQVDKLRIYRNINGIPSSFYYLTSVTLGTSTYTDDTLDTGLGDPLDLNMFSYPGIASVCGRYKNRLLYSTTTEPRYIYYSYSKYPEKYNPLMTEQVLAAGDVCVAIHSSGDYGYVFGKQAVYIIQITANDILQFIRTDIGRGCVGQTVATGSLGVYFVSNDGIYLIDGLSAVKVSQPIDALFRGIDRGGLSTIKDWDTIKGAYVSGKYYMTYEGNDDQWHTLVLDEQSLVQRMGARFEHYTGWRYVTRPLAGTFPVVGLPNSVGLQGWDYIYDDDQEIFSACGLNLTLAPTMLTDVRQVRLSVECQGTLTLELWDADQLKFSTTLTNVRFSDGYQKVNTPIGVYFLQPELRVSSSSPFELRFVEADLYGVRYETHEAWESAAFSFRKRAESSS